jgi:hypothetical protein
LRLLRSRAEASSLATKARHHLQMNIQATLAFNALRNATNNFTMSCGFIGCSTFASAMFSSL